MKKSKTFVKCLLAAHSLIAPISLQALELLTSQDAWNATDVVASSNSGGQNNTRNGGVLDGWGGAVFKSNAASEYIDMQAAVDNPQQNYTAGYTYSYQSLGHSATDAHNNTFKVELLANGSVTGDSVSGNNYTFLGTAGSNNISGELQVADGSSLIDQQIGMRISSDGEQTRWNADGTTSLSALLTNHAGFDGGDGVGELYSTSFSGGLQVTDHDHVLDMSLTMSGGAIDENYFRLNNNNTQKNTGSFKSTDTFRADTAYTITMTALKMYIADETQNSIDIVMGDNTHTETITVPTTVTTLDFTINADDVGLAGKAFEFDITANGFTTGGANQYRIYDFRVEAIPEPDSVAFWAASLTLTWIMTRRRFKATKAQV